jgi:predicted acyltransferase
MTTEKLRTEPQKRLYSLDALRGFDMFWITGGGALISLLAKATGAGWLETQMDHVKWDGFHFFDLIFPLFMFISGVAVVFAVQGKLEKNVPKRRLLWKVFKRLVLLILLGLLYNGVFRNGFEGSRIASVLGQIGVGYFCASLIVIFFDSMKARLVWLAGILAAFGVIQLLIPVPGIGAGVLTPEGCINGYIDRMLLPGKLYGGTFDPEGILCCLSATGITLFGTIAGTILWSRKSSEWQKIKIMLATGIGLILFALLLSTFYPIIKVCWTSTFNILTGGISFILLSLFYLIIDIWGFRKWAFYFRIIGMNSIFVYLFTRMVNAGSIGQFFIGWLIKPLSETGQQIFTAIGGLAVVWLVLYFLYKKNFFLRV